MCLRVFALLICFSTDTFAQTTSQDYLHDAFLPVPTNGSKVGTAQPLAPYTTYRLKITSTFDLKPLYSENQGNYQSDIQIDGRTLRAVSFDESSDGHLGSLEFLFHGYGKPIYIGFVKDHHNNIESAQVHIYVEGKWQKIWRESFSRTWRDYGDWILVGLVISPFILMTWYYFSRRNRKLRAEERDAEKERQALILNSHNKRIELIREIDRKAQQKAREMIARNYDELQKKIFYWRSRAYSESYFLNPDLRHNFAVANRERIINELEKKWTQEFLAIAQDLELAKALRDQEPGVMHWIQARQEVVNIAHQLTWANHQVIDAYYEEMPDTPQIIIVDEVEEAEKAAHGRIR